jgi:hypothetical protein
MEQYLTDEIIRAFGEGNFVKFLSYHAIFIVLWMEIRGMKNELKDLNKIIATKFIEGEQRFDAIEARLHEIEIKQMPKEAAHGFN